MAGMASCAPRRAVTTRSAPRTLSPPAKAPGRDVRPSSSTSTSPQSLTSMPEPA